ncbi:Transposon TX1 uncharacterized protein [Tetrabaena socialis]|uniref:Transposon TX1 uncharacterized protein n=1 Tax=Tetrabaena socialis TaxID=47790 RepID=A0A2J8ACN9_9CHLO|nr:Transposon TX1 uncharacterized protein [Tetrabaena socialis]|eukprot:PNH10273.1 Transposon TX1 uncharacterized protein [Tetrabaena socialis]
MPRRHRSSCRTLPALRVGSHNVRGLLGAGIYGDYGRLIALLRCWTQQRLDVVCVQETHICSCDIPRATSALLSAAKELRLGNWRTWRAPAPSSRSGGVAIFIRSALFTSGVLQLRADTPAPAAATAGRLLHLPVAWGGHDFTLACAYLPSGNFPAQRAFILAHLAPLAAAPGAHVWAADFNFVTDPTLDGTSARPPDAATARCFVEACPGLADAFRALHPTRRAFSFICPISASRLDRILISTATLPSVLSCAIVAGHPADHRLVCAGLAATPAASPPGPGLHRVRLHLLDFADLRERLRAWIETAVAAAPTDPSALLDWWPAFKRSLSISAGPLSQVARGRHVDAAAAEKAANSAADAAFAAVEEGDVAALPHAARARSAAAAAAVKATVGAARHTRHAWLRTGERPSPVITWQARPPAAWRLIPALRRPDGTSTADPSKMPGIMVAFWQRVCTAAATDPAARRVAAVEDTLGRVARLPLSTFGRAFAASGYALGRSLYHAEFAGLPMGPQLNWLRQTTAALVDRALSPAAYTANPHARLVGVGAACMPAPPPRSTALASCHWWSIHPAWALVALALLRHLHHAATPLCLLTARVLPAQGVRRASILVLGCPAPSTCPALIQLASAFSALPPPLMLPSPALEPGTLVL